MGDRIWPRNRAVMRNLNKLLDMHVRLAVFAGTEIGRLPSPYENSGCRAGAVRSAQNCDVDLNGNQVVFRHAFAGKYLIDRGGKAFTLQKLFCRSALEMAKHCRAVLNADAARFGLQTPME